MPRKREKRESIRAPKDSFAKGHFFPICFNNNDCFSIKPFLWVDDSIEDHLIIGELGAAPDRRSAGAPHWQVSFQISETASDLAYLKRDFRDVVDPG